MSDQEPVRAEYMFGILGYSTWNLYQGPDFLGQVTLNGADNTVVFTPSEEPLQKSWYFIDRSFPWWMKFVRQAQNARLPGF